MFFAGAESKLYWPALDNANVDSRLESYFYKVKGAKSEPPYSQCKNFLLDSGGFSARKSGVKIDVRKYAQYLNHYKVKFAFNLDTNDVEETLRNQKFLEIATKSYIIPIYHMSDYLNPKTRDMLNDFLAYPFIGVARARTGENVHEGIMTFLNYVFSRTGTKTAVHGLAITTDKYLVQYPFFSVDSTTWLNGTKYGTSKVYKCPKQLLYRNKRIDYVTRCMDDVIHFKETARFATNLWKSRGVTWPDSLEELLPNERSK